MDNYPILTPEERAREKAFDVGLNEDLVGLRPNDVEPTVAAAEDEFGVTDRLADAGKGVAQGANQLAQGVFDIWKNTGGYINKALASPLNGASTLSRAIGNDGAADFFDRINFLNDNAEWFDKGEAENLALTQIFSDNNAIYEDSKSDHFKERKAALEERIENAEGQVDKAYATFMGTLSDPSLAVDFLAKQIPMLTGLGAVGRAGQAAALSRGASAATAGKVGTATAVGVGGTMQGGSVATETYERLLEQSPEMWAINDKYIELLNNNPNMSEDQARLQIANDLRESTFLGATAISVLANMLPGARALERSLVGVKLNPGAGSVIGRTIAGGVGEGVSEAIEEGGGQLLGNAAVKTVNPEQELSEGVGRAAGEAALAFLPGAAGGALQRTETPSAENQSGNDTNGNGNPIQDTTTGEVSEAETGDINDENPSDESETEAGEVVDTDIKDPEGNDRRISRTETRPEDNYSGEERRIDAARRKKVAEMSPEDAVNAFYKNELTGLLNRRAFEEDLETATNVTSIDLDALKATNDYGSPEAGDQLLKNAANAFKEVFGNSAYHISGDEFYIRNPPPDLDAKMEEVRSILSESKIETTKNGKRVTIEGGDFSYGTADNKDAADAAMKDFKIQREKDGKRAARKDLPKNIKYYDADGKQLSARLNEAGELSFDGDTTATTETTKEKSKNVRQENGSINDQKRDDGRQEQSNDRKQESPEAGKSKHVKGESKESGVGENQEKERSRQHDERQHDGENSDTEKRDANEDLPQVKARAKLDARKRAKSESGRQKIRLTELADQHDTQESFEKAVRAEFGPGAYNKFKTLGNLDSTYKDRDPVRGEAKRKADADIAKKKTLKQKADEAAAKKKSDEATKSDDDVLKAGRFPHSKKIDPNSKLKQVAGGKIRRNLKSADGDNTKGIYPTNWKNSKTHERVRGLLLSGSSKDTMPRIKTAKAILSNWADTYGVEGVEIVSFRNIPAEVKSRLGKNLKNRSASYGALGVIVLKNQVLNGFNSNASANDSAQATETLAHEFGHAMQQSLYDKLPRSMQKAIVRDFGEFLLADKSIEETVKQYPPAIFNALKNGNFLENSKGREITGQDAFYVSKFNEWLANNIAHYLVHKTVTSDLSMPSKSGIKKIASKIREFYVDLFKSNSNDTKGFTFAKSIEEFMEYAAENHKELAKVSDGNIVGDTNIDNIDFGVSNIENPEVEGRKAVKKRTSQEIRRRKGAKLRRFLKRNFHTEGLLNARNSVQAGLFNNIDTPFQSKLKADGAKLRGEKEIEILNQQLRKGKPTLKDWEKANEYLNGKEVKLPKEVKEPLDAMRSYLDVLSEEIMDGIKDRIEIRESKYTEEQKAESDLYYETNGKEGFIPDDVLNHLIMLNTIEDNKGSYLHRSYAAFSDGTDWMNHVLNKRPELIENAIEFIMEENPGLTEQEAKGTVSKILQEASGTGDFTAFLSKGSKYGSKDVSILKQKKEVPVEIRELLGEHKDVRVNFSTTATKMGYLVSNHKFLMSLHDNLIGNLLFKKEKTVGAIGGDMDFNSEIVGNDTMSPINGYFTTAEFKQGLEDAVNIETHGDIAKTLMATNSIVKYGKTILSTGTQIVNLLGGSFFIILNGHAKQLINGGFAQAYNIAVADLAGDNFFGNAITGKKWDARAYNAYILHLIDEGVLHNTPMAGEMRRAFEDVAEFRTTTEGPMHWKNILMFMQKTYQLGDDFWKIMGYESEKASKLKAGFSQKEAEKIAADRIRNGYPTYSMVSRGFEKVRRWYLVGTFVSFPYEVARTSFNQFRFIKEDLKNDRPAAFRRIAGMAVTHSSMYAASAFTASLMGLRGEDDEAFRKLLPPWNRNSTLLYTGYDENGMPTALDMSRYNPYAYLQKPINALLNGNNKGADEKISDAMAEIASPFLGTEITASALIEIYTNQKENEFGPVVNKQDNVWKKNWDRFNHLRKAMQPTIANQLVDNMLKAYRGETSGGRQRKYSDEFKAMAGFRSMTINVKQSIKNTTYAFVSGRNDANQILSRRLKTTGNLSEKQIESAYNAMNKARERVYNEMIDNIRLGRLLGVPDNELFEIIDSSNVSKKDVTAMMKGEIPKWEMSSRFVKQWFDLNVLTAASQKNKDKLREQFSERRKIVKKLIREDK